MDSMTHLLVGHAMGAVAASTATPYGAALYWAALIGNSLPDIDVPISLILRRDVKLHRTVTHTIPGAIALAAITAIGINWVIPGAPFGLIFGWAMLGLAAHIGMDCLNLFGARPFWPLNGRSVEMGVLHILDPVLVVLLGLPALGAALGMASPSLLALSFFLMWPYIAYRIFTARKLERLLRAEGPSRVRIIPGFASWRYLFETDSGIEFGYWLKGKRQIKETYTKLQSPLIRASLANPQVAAFLASAEYPYARVQGENETHEVVWADALRQMRADFRPLRIPVKAAS